MSLLGDVVRVLLDAGSHHAMVGATALAVLGASRSTQDLDILTTDRRLLARSAWGALESEGATVEIRHGDIQDPLVGVVRLTREGERPIDVIVGEAPWQERILRDAPLRAVTDARVPVVEAVGLVLLKLYAGGPQDLWDIEQLLQLSADRKRLEEEITARLSELPARCRTVWQRRWSERS